MRSNEGVNKCEIYEFTVDICTGSVVWSGSMDGDEERRTSCANFLRDEQRRKYSKMDKRAKDELVRTPRENGGG